MKIDLLKNLIKDSVREVLLQELPSLLKEMYNTNATSLVNSQIKPNVNSSKAVVPSSNSIQEILNNTRKDMTRQDLKNYLGDFGTDSVSSEGSSETHNQGIDISNLSFVQKASLIHKKLS
jgi:hypothetical protein